MDKYVDKIYKKVSRHYPLIKKSFIENVLNCLTYKKLRILGSENAINIIEEYLSHSKIIRHLDCDTIKNLRKYIGSGVSGNVYCSDKNCSYAIKIIPFSGDSTFELEGEVEVADKLKKMRKLGILTPKIYDCKICYIKGYPTGKKYGRAFDGDGAVVVIMDFIKGIALHKMKHIDNDIVDKLFEYFKIMQDNNIPHGDLNLGNIIYSDGKLTLIDPVPYYATYISTTQDFSKLIATIYGRVDLSHLFKKIKEFAKHSIRHNIEQKHYKRVMEIAKNENIEEMIDYIYYEMPFYD